MDLCRRIVLSVKEEKSIRRMEEFIMKKKIAAAFITGVLLVSVGTVGVLAAGHGHGRGRMGRYCSSSERIECMDKEQDRECVCGQESRYGICEECPGFGDEDNNGICDHHEERQANAERGHGCRRGNRR